MKLKVNENMNKCVSFVLLLSLCTAMTGGVVLKDSGYEGVVVAIEDDLPVSLCQEVLLGLEVR